MYCQHCGKEIENGATFCVYCGKGVRVESPGRGMYGHQLTRLKVPDETKNPGVAAAIGFFLGWIFLGPVGYVYLAQWNWFWLTFVIQIFALPLTAGLAYVLLPVVFAIHQYQMAKELNEMVVEKRVESQAACDENSEENGEEPGGGIDYPPDRRI